MNMILRKLSSTLMPTVPVILMGMLSRIMSLHLELLPFMACSKAVLTAKLASLISSVELQDLPLGGRFLDGLFFPNSAISLLVAAHELND